MTERSTTSCRRLFEVRLLHHYWLDDGDQRFDTLAADVQVDRLLRYHVRPLLRVVPTPSTLKQLGSRRCLFMPTGQGFVMAVPSNATFDATATFSFAVSIANGDCLDYTALTFCAQVVQEASEHWLWKTNLLRLEVMREGEPLMSGRLIVNPESIEEIVTGKVGRPAFSVDFPAEHIETAMDWDDLVLNSLTRAQIREIEHWIMHNDTLMDA